MSSKSPAQVPGKVLDDTIAFGLTFEELSTLAAIPLAMIFPAIYIPFIPLWFTLILITIGYLGVGVVILKTPPGQTPTEWFPAYIDRKLKPDTYRLQPQTPVEGERRAVVYQDVVYTSDQIRREEESQAPTDIETLIEEIDLAERLDRPDQSSTDTGDDNDPSETLNEPSTEASSANQSTNIPFVGGD